MKIPDAAPLRRIASDVELGRDVKIYDFTNLYGCRIGDDTKIGTFVEIQNLTNTTVANGMRVDLKTVLDCDFRRAFDVFYRLENQSRSTGQIFVRFKLPCAVGDERAIDLALDRADSQEVITLGEHLVLGQYFVHGLVRLSTNHDVQPYRQVAFFLEFPEEIDAFERRTCILE